MTGTILAIDPGSERSAWLALRDGTPSRFAIEPNADLLTALRGLATTPVDVVVIEQIESYGMAVGREIFATVHWSGRFTEAAEAAGIRAVQLPRRAVKLHPCQSPKAKDANVHQALVDRYGGIGGKAAAVGRKAAPGPLYGIANDVWSALAIAVTYADSEGRAA